MGVLSDGELFKHTKFKSSNFDFFINLFSINNFSPNKGKSQKYIANESNF